MFLMGYIFIGISHILFLGGICYEQEKNLLNNGLLWFGASISIAEILTGGLIALFVFYVKL